MSLANAQFTCPRYPPFILNNENQLTYSRKQSIVLPNISVTDSPKEELSLCSTVEPSANSGVADIKMPTNEQSNGNDTVDLTRISDIDVNSCSTEKNAAIPTTSSKSKHAPMPIYRPPSLRGVEGSSASSPKLNVHAKEFVINNSSTRNYDVMRSSSTKTDQNFQNHVSKMKELVKSNKTFFFNLSKSSGNVTFNASKPDSSQNGKSSANFKDTTNVPSFSSSSYDLQRAKSIGDVLMNTRINGTGVSKVQFTTPAPDKNINRYSGKPSPIKDKKSPPFSAQQVPGNLKRSKSMSAADALKFMEMEASFSQLSSSAFSDYHLFPEKIQNVIKQAIHNSHRMTDKNKIVLARTVIEHAIKDKKYANPVARLSIIIMEKDKSGAYLDSLLNSCQMFYQKKETSLFDGAGRFTSFLSFLTEMFIELKRSKLQMKLASDPIAPPEITFLILISRCCLDILVRKETHSTSEIECLFLTLTSVGRDIELELPAMFQKLFHTIRIVFLRSSNVAKIQKTLLQLIELRAANWQLPVSALNYYYPKSSD